MQTSNKAKMVQVVAVIVAATATMAMASCTKSCRCTFYDHGVAQITTLDNEAPASGKCSDLTRTRDDGGVLTGVVCGDQ